MSDLAPFVAAALRDKVVSDLQKENERLQKQLTKFAEVQITGPEGQPVYATGSFGEGERCGEAFWDVDIETVSEGSLALFQGDIEIHLGGVEYVKTSDGSSYVSMIEKDWDGEDRKEVQLVVADNTPKRCALHVRISGWPKSNWEAMKELDFSTRGNDEPADILWIIGRTLSVELPDATVSFPSISFGTRGVKNVIDNLGIPPLSETEAEERRKNMERRMFIVSCLREAGNQEFGKAFSDLQRDILYSLYMLSNEDELTDEQREIIPTLVTMRSESSGTAPFLRLVKTRYDLADQDWHAEMFAQLEAEETENE